MKKMYKVWAIWQICEAVILLAAGVLTIIFSDDPDLYKWIFLAIGAFIILDGVLRVLMPFFNKDPGDNSLFTGIFEVTFGIVIVLRSAAITEILMILSRLYYSLYRLSQSPTELSASRKSRRRSSSGS
jgi:uncharacterized membrane protein HdeD (DUF308 family)